MARRRNTHRTTPRGRAAHPTARGQVLDLATIAARRRAIADLQPIRWRDCTDPTCPQSGTRHAEELCETCSVQQGKPVYHLIE